MYKYMRTRMNNKAQNKSYMHIHIDTIPVCSDDTTAPWKSLLLLIWRDGHLRWRVWRCVGGVLLEEVAFEGKGGDGIGVAKSAVPTTTNLMYIYTLVMFCVASCGAVQRCTLSRPPQKRNEVSGTCCQLHCCTQRAKRLSSLRGLRRFPTSVS